MKRMIPLVIICASVAAMQAQTDSVSANELQEVVIKGEKPQLRSSGGVMTVDLPSIVSDKPVTNIFEALNYLPGVINTDGQPAIAGASSTTIIINGQPSQLSAEQIRRLLASMPVDRLKSVEIMHAAPASYHVRGGVINVVLKTPSALDGLQGQATMEGTLEHYASFGGDLSAAYAIGGWTFDLDWSLARNRSWSAQDDLSRHTLADGLHIVEQRDRQSGSALSNTVYASAGYRIGESHTVGATYCGQIKSDEWSDNYSEGSFGSFLNSGRYQGPHGLHSVNLTYKAPYGLSVTVDYLGYRENRHQLMTRLQDNTIAVSSDNNQRINRWHFTADMEHQTGIWTIGYGASYRLGRDRSSMTYVVPDNPGFENSLVEHTAEAYFSSAASFPWGLSMQASLGEELYRVDGRSYWTFQPSLGLTFYRTPLHIFQASLTTDRNYPSYWTLHGGTGYLSPYSEIRGTPGLLPSTNYSANITYLWRQKYVAQLFVSLTNGYFVQLPYQDPDELKLIFQELNLDSNRKFGFNFVAPFSIGDRLNLRFTSQGYYNRVKTKDFHSISFDRRKFVIYGSLQTSVRLMAGLSLSLDVAGISSSLQGIADLSALWRVDAGIKWAFGRGNACELTLNASDIFNRWSPTMRINSEGQDYRMKIYDMSRSWKLAFSWRFHGFKPKERSIDSSRLGTSHH